MSNQYRPLLIGAFVVLAAVAVTVAWQVRPGQAQFVNDPAAQADYGQSLQRATNQPRLTVHMSLRSNGPPTKSVGGGGGRSVTRYVVRSWRSSRIAVHERTSSNAPAFLAPVSIVLMNHQLCLSRGGDRWVCSPTHRIADSWYIRAYLLGGLVGNLRFQQGSTTRTGGIRIRFSGGGILGCTPAGAGAGTRKGYTWCSFKRLDSKTKQQRITGQLTIDRHSGLPRRLTASQSLPQHSVSETATFSYGGRFTVGLPAHYVAVPCMSYVPAIHCIELGKAH
jgi:hypothetical protein